MSAKERKTHMIIRTDDYGSHYMDIPTDVNYGCAVDLLKYYASLESVRNLEDGCVIDGSITVTDKWGKKIKFEIEEHLIIEKEKDSKPVVAYSDNPHDLDYFYWH